MTEHFDVVMMADVRLMGGPSSSMTEEIKAQHTAGYRTALVPLNRTILPAARDFHPAITRCIEDGLATLVLPDTPLSAGICLLRQPGAFREPSDRPYAMQVDHLFMVANSAPAEPAETRAHYRVEDVHANVAEAFGREPTWAPIGPLLRTALDQPSRRLPMLPWDWLNIIDADLWYSERSTPRGARPVIGRHSRPQPHKWPADPQAILGAYPPDPDIRVRILGGADVPEKTLGHLPANWEVLPFGSVAPVDFLRGIDFYVYYHHETLVEAFGRGILEALASGAVTLLPPHFEVLFQEAAVYAEAKDVAATVHRFYDDWWAYRSQSELAREVVRARFSHEQHVRRLQALIGPPAQPRRTAIGKPASKTTALFVTTNGTGLGHLSRTMAIARKAAGTQPVFLTMSESFGLVSDNGFPVEYVGSREALNMKKPRWEVFFEHRLEEAIDMYRPRVMLFDGVAPYKALDRVRLRHREVQFVWCRRPMWKPGSPWARTEASEYFDHVLEPTDFAQSQDRGATATATDERTQVRPITLFDYEELADPVTAAQELGLDPSTPSVLIQLADGDPAQLVRMVESVTARLLEVPDLQVYVPQSLIHGRSVVSDPRIHGGRVYPLARLLRAFTFAISATGYNSYHELLEARVPAVFIPKGGTNLDDQEGRARFAAMSGVGLFAESVDDPGFDEALRLLVRDDARQDLVRAIFQQYPGNGAAEAMRFLEGLAGVRL